MWSRIGRCRPGAVVLVTVLALSAGACSSGGSHRASSRTTTPTGGGTSTSVSTTSAPASSSTSGASTTLGSPPPAGAIPIVLPASAPSDGVSPAGSGCTPRSSTTLPDGEWFGILRSADPSGGTVGLDLECLYWGAAANNAARQDGLTEIPVPNDHYERNRSALVYTQRAVPDVSVSVLGAGGSATTRYPTAHGVAAAERLIGASVWIQITQGWVTAIQQQYFP